MKKTKKNKKEEKKIVTLPMKFNPGNMKFEPVLPIKEPEKKNGKRKNTQGR